MQCHVITWLPNASIGPFFNYVKLQLPILLCMSGLGEELEPD